MRSQTQPPPDHCAELARMLECERAALPHEFIDWEAVREREARIQSVVYTPTRKGAGR